MFNALKKPMASSALICSLILVGCGGSGSSDSDVIASEDITWTQGVFEP